MARRTYTPRLANLSARETRDGYYRGRPYYGSGSWERRVDRFAARPPAWLVYAFWGVVGALIGTLVTRWLTS